MSTTEAKIEYIITVIETNEHGNTMSTPFGFVEFITSLYESKIKPKVVHDDAKAFNRDLIEVVTNDKDVIIHLPNPEKGKNITIYIVKSDDGKGHVIVSGSIEGKEYHKLKSKNDKQKYISVNGSEFRKW